MMTVLTKDYAIDGYTDEFVIGLVGAIGVNWHAIVDDTLVPYLQKCGYSTVLIDVSEDIIENIGADLKLQTHSYSNNDLKFNKAMVQMDLGNDIRKIDPYLTANAIATMICSYRMQSNNGLGLPCGKTAFIIKSLKNPNEIKRLRQIYQNGLYVFGVFTSEEDREKRLTTTKNMSKENARILINRDENEASVGEYGQHTRDTFQMADFFIDATDANNLLPYIERIVKLMFGDPFITPTFGEYAMFIAYCASLRSGDLSRQIGAAICKNNEIIATGVNDCPKCGGGLYWQKYDYEKHMYIDDEKGKDFTRGCDSNKMEIREIAENIYSTIADKLNDNIPQEDIINNIISATRLGELTEFGRPVHAEMEALTMCARNNISCREADLYVTTFPCHNCTKHIVASGIKEVIYIEAYPKSKAFVLYDDSIVDSSRKKESRDNKILYRPFFGVGPRKFIAMFGLDYGFIDRKLRKNKDGRIREFDVTTSTIRNKMPTMFYIEREKTAACDYAELIKKATKGDE